MGKSRIRRIFFSHEVLAKLLIELARLQIIPGLSQIRCRDAFSIERLHPGWILFQIVSAAGKSSIGGVVPVNFISRLAGHQNGASILSGNGKDAGSSRK